MADLSRQFAHLTERGATCWSALFVALLVTLALAPAVYGSDSSGNTWSQVVPRFEWGACPTRVAKLLAEENASCGYLVVPENRTKANGRTIRLPVAIIPSVSPRPSPDPIVYMAGGPGADALSETPTLVKTGLNKKRDLIVMNQRGNKDARPELTCPEIDRFLIKLISLPYDADSTKALHLAATRACHDRLVRKGIDLSAYNTTENSADFADLLKVLRKVLKIKEWNVYGLSYGTNLALSYLRDHPEGIRSVIIDSVAPPRVVTLGWTWTSADEGIHNIFNACAAQPGCSHAFGDLADVFASLVQRYEADPLITTVPSPFGGPPVKVVIDGGHLANWLAAVLQPGIKNSEIPAAIGALDRGDPKPIANSRAFFTDPSGIGVWGHGLLYGVFCSEWVPFERQSRILVQGQIAFPTWPDSVLSLAPQLPFMNEDCEIWNVPPASRHVRKVTKSTVPTLVITGSFDGRTSPRWGKYAAKTLQNSTNIVIPGSGHGVAFQTPCADEVIASFLSKPFAPDTSCVSKLKLPTFVTSFSPVPFNDLDIDLMDYAN